MLQFFKDLLKAPEEARLTEGGRSPIYMLRAVAISETRLFGIGGAIVASPSVRHFAN